MMTEAHIRPLLATWRELDDATRARLEAHLAGCAECRAAKAAYARQDCLLRDLPVVSASAGLGAAVRARIAPPAPASRPAWLPRVAAIVATLIVVALSASTVAVSAQALPGDFLYPVKRTVEQVALTVLSVSQQQAAFEDTLAERRRFEARQVLDLQRDVPVEFAGALEHLEDGGWTVAGLPVELEQGALETAGVQPGDAVVISGETHAGQIWVRVVNREPQRAGTPAAPLASPTAAATHTPMPSSQATQAGGRRGASSTPPAMPMATRPAPPVPTVALPATPTATQAVPSTVTPTEPATPIATQPAVTATASMAASPTASPAAPFPSSTPRPRRTGLPGGSRPTSTDSSTPTGRRQVPLPTDTRQPHWPLPSATPAAPTPAATDVPPPATPTPANLATATAVLPDTPMPAPPTATPHRPRPPQSSPPPGPTRRR